MLITLEGIDGSGKTTAWEALQDTFPEFTYTREPTDSWYGETVDRSVADRNADPLAELFLYTADHADHLSRLVRPALEDGQVVVSDRYSDSRYAYQSVAIADLVDRPIDYVRGVHQPFSRAPDATIYLDVDAETGAARSGATNKFEQVPFLRQVRENYRHLQRVHADRYITVDATRAPEDVLAAVESVVNDLVEGDREAADFD